MKPEIIVKLEIELGFDICLREVGNVIYWHNTYLLNANQDVIGLNLTSNKILDISPLEKLTQLKYLNLRSNEIKDISVLASLTQLNYLNLGDNQITDVSALREQTQLRELDLSFNRIKDISALAELKQLIKLKLSNNFIDNITFLSNITELSYLSLADNQINEITVLGKLQKIKYLNLNGNIINNTNILKKLENIDELYLSRTGIRDISFLLDLKRITRLGLADNEISDITFLSQLKKLKYLKIKNNLITDISYLKDLNQLTDLDLSDNQIQDISSLQGLEYLDIIYLAGNPITRTTISNFNDNSAIKGYLKSLRQKNLLVDNLSVKINILGAGRIGKTQLFNWLLGKKFEKKSKITHGTGVDTYKLTNNEYMASLWDFGGQSYQHGTHSLFLRPKDFYVVLYRAINDNYSYGYWLGAARTFASEKIDGKYNIPLFLVQSYWGSDLNDTLIYPDSKKIHNYQVDPNSVFAVDVRLQSTQSDWKLKNDFFIEALNKEIISYAKSFGQIPKRFVDEKEKIDNKSFDIYIKRDVFKATVDGEYDEDDFAYLLQYLEFTGSIIYFREKKELDNYIFTNPQELSDWIYKTVLNEAFLEKNQGVLDFDKIKKDFGNEKAKIFKELMTQFNLLFEEPHDESAKKSNHLVIPQFLPENNNTFKKVLLELIPFTYSIKFEDFIYEGRIFNFISEYGQYAKDKTSYWKYGILFRKNDIQTIVYYDIQNRIINVHLENKKGYINLAQEILYYFILIQDNKELPISKFKDTILNESRSRNEKNIDNADLKRKVVYENVIIGSQLSTNNINYINIIETLKLVDNEIKIGFCVESNKNIKLDLLTLKLLGMNDKKLKKVFISYSRKDLKYKDTLKSHLSLLERYDLVKSWSCEEVKAGNWDKQIQQELEESDIIVYMISHNFMDSNYIMNDEVRKGIELVENDTSKKIICVLTGVCQWQSWSQFESIYNQSKDDKGKFSTMDLSQYQFLPYHQYKNNEGDPIREEIVALEKWGRHPYDVVNEAYNQIVDKIFSEIK